MPFKESPTIHNLSTPVPVISPLHTFSAGTGFPTSVTTTNDAEFSLSVAPFEFSGSDGSVTRFDESGSIGYLFQPGVYFINFTFPISAINRGAIITSIRDASNNIVSPAFNHGYARGAQDIDQDTAYIHDIVNIRTTTRLFIRVARGNVSNITIGAPSSQVFIRRLGNAV